MVLESVFYGGDVVGRVWESLGDWKDDAMCTVGDG
jgi:hypothetical protein